MASKIKETHTLSVEGFLDLDNEEILIEVEEFSEPLELRDLLKKFNGCNIKLSLKLANDITE